MTDAGTKQPPLVRHYPSITAVMLCALVPNIVLATAFTLQEKQIGASLHMSQLTLRTIEGLSNAGYAFGAVLGAYLTQKFLQRKLYLVTQAFFVVCSLLATLAWTALPYEVGRIAQGFATGLMLIIALPPLVTQYDVGKLPRTAVAINIGLFGAVTVGPVLAGAVSLVSWRLLFAFATTAAVAGLVLAWLALPRDIGAFDRSRPADVRAFTLALVATVAPFFAAAQLGPAHFGDPVVAVPLGVGVVLIGVLSVEQYRKKNPLMPVRELATSLPVMGTVAAMVAGAGFVTFIELAATQLTQGRHESVLHTGLLLSPAVGGLTLTAAAYGIVLRTRYLPVFILAGMGLIFVGGLIEVFSMSDAGVIAASAVLGAGAGATVSPGLFFAAFGVVSKKLGRAFALVELVRSEADFIIGPILLYVALGATQLRSGVRFATEIMLVITGAGIVALIGLFFSSGAQLRAPDFDGWLNRDEQAMHSPRTAQRLPVRR